MSEPIQTKPVGAFTVTVADNVDAYWPEFEPGFRRGCEKSGGQLSTGELWTQCKRGDAWLLVAKDELQTPWGACIVKFETWPNGMRLRGLGLSGTHMRAWMPAMIELVRKFGKMGGAIAFVDQGEPGMLKALQSAGQAKILGVVYEVRL